MWPDLAKSCHYQNLKTLWAFFWMSYSVFGKLLCQLWHFYATGQIVIVVTSHILNSNIGSHLVTLLSLSLSRIGTHLHILEYSLLQHSSTISFFLSSHTHVQVGTPWLLCLSLTQLFHSAIRRYQNIDFVTFSSQDEQLLQNAVVVVVQSSPEMNF